ncbi:hypothetical protein AAG570_012836 [Ranatra chinensis]|uniref:Uncharacterized protein n=1 Tax=Ranatra chinensis TaxID=642074 RepID=A0ABD0YTN4_9HEMI
MACKSRNFFDENAKQGMAEKDSCVGLGAHQNKDKPSNKSCLKPSIISPDNSLGSSPITLKCSTKCADEVNSQDQRNEKDHSALPLPLPRLPEVQHSSNTIYVRMLEAVRSLYASQVSYAAEKSPKMRTHFAKQSDRICRSDIAALDAPPFTRISSILKRPQEPTRLILEQSSMTLGTSFSEDSFEGIPHSKRSVSWSSMVKSEKLTAPKRPPVTRPPKARLPTARGSPSGTLFEFQNKGTTYYDRLRRYTLLGEDPYLRKMVRDLADIFQHFTDPYGCIPSSSGGSIVMRSKLRRAARNVCQQKTDGVRNAI